MLKVSGKDLGKLQNESGQHIVQRVSPTERSGRRHTSVISVAVLPLPPQYDVLPLPNDELEITPTLGSGPGGSHRNKNLTAIRARHIPTGTIVFIDGRSQDSNKKDAIRILTQRVRNHEKEVIEADYNNVRKAQVKTGRGGKRRTYNYIDNRITDHVSGKKVYNVDSVIRKGNFECCM